jgi:O-antigen/teichoic acid export membrane protein
MNHGLVIISPIVVVRLLSVEQFGRYREFLLYASVLYALSSLGVSSSLLHFVPHRPQHAQRFVDQTVWMTLATSVIVIGAAALLNVVLDGAVAGEYMLPVAIYVALFVNFDFWEHLWIAEKRTLGVFAYTTGRLLARLTVVIVAAALTADVNVIIWSLVALEAVRCLISLILWTTRRQGRPEKLPGSWREQIRFCLPVGVAAMLTTLNRSMGGMFVVKMLGPVALAHYVIGTYLHPVLAILRSSMSDALLPEMSAHQPQEQSDPLLLWRRMSVIAAILLTAAAVILARFAEILIVTLFSPEYRSAVLVFQIYLIVLLRESLDFAVPLRAINRTAPIMYCNLLSLAINAVLLAVLLPTLGITGAAAAFVVSRTIDGFYLGLQTSRAYGISVRELASWSDLAKVPVAAALASVVLYGSFWTESFGLLSALAGALCFLLIYSALLLYLRVPEAFLLLRYVQRFPRAFATRT